MYVEKLEFYKKKILDKLYFLTKDNIKNSGDWFHLYNKNQFIQNLPDDDKSIIDAVWGELNYTYIKIQHYLIRFSERGIINYEKKYRPQVTLMYTDLLIPSLIAIFEGEKSSEKKDISSYIREYNKKKFGFNISDNDIYVIITILGAYNYLKVHHAMGGSIIYLGMTDTGKSTAIRSIPKSPIENAILNLSQKLLELDYYEKDLKICSLKLKKWIDQFETEEEKLSALFLVENLYIASNETCKKAWNTFYEEKFNKINPDDIYLLAAGNPGSSGEAWRHKFAREIYKGKEQSRTLEAIKKKTTPSDWKNKYIIFVDDMIGSGDQFKTFFHQNMMKTGSKEILEQFKDTNILYFVVIATEYGIEYITTETPVKKDDINSKIILPKLFDSSNPLWDKTTPINKEVCQQMCEKYGKSIYPSHPLGYLDSQLLVAFQDHTPDNTIPIFWWSENWYPLLER